MMCASYSRFRTRCLLLVLVVAVGAVSDEGQLIGLRPLGESQWPVVEFLILDLETARIADPVTAETERMQRP